MPLEYFEEGMVWAMVSEIGFNIRNLRQKHNMSQDQLAKKLNAAQ